jgi:hypothetical protein
MKKLIVIFLLIATKVAAQSHSADILKFVDDNKGKKIGTGLCYELIQGAIRTYLDGYNMGFKDFDKKFYGKKIKKSKIEAGDILFLSGGTKRKINHVCIVYKIDGDIVWIAEQNVGCKQKDSVVIIHKWDKDFDEFAYGKIDCNYYRPK